jgi:hypothetical protein
MMDSFLLTSLDGALTVPLAAVRRRVDHPMTIGSESRPARGECL